MPRRKKKAHEQTTDEAMKRLFPKEVVRKLRAMAEADSTKTKGGKRDRRKRNKD